MISASYGVQTCSKCHAHRYCRGELEPHFGQWEAPNRWPTFLCRAIDSAYIRRSTSGCPGCTSVARNQCIVLGYLLCKLGIDL